GDGHQSWRDRFLREGSFFRRSRHRIGRMLSERLAGQHSQPAGIGYCVGPAFSQDPPAAGCHDQGLGSMPAGRKIHWLGFGLHHYWIQVQEPHRRPVQNRPIVPMLIKQSTSVKVVPFFLVDSGDHISPKTGLTPTVTISKNGAAFGAPAGAVTEIGNGWYKIAANATDSNTLGSLLVHATATGADPFDVIHEVVEATLAKGTDITGFNDITTANVQSELVTYGALNPTVAGRALDVSTGGEAGLDWANIGAPTTAQNISATTISTSPAVASVSGSVGSVTGAVGSVTGAVTVGTNNDKVNYSLTAGERTSIATAIWNTLTSTLTTASTIGKLLVDNLNATVSSAVGDTPGTTTLLSRIASALTITAGKVDVKYTTGFALTAAYDPAKVAASQTSVNGVKTTTDNLATAMELDGAVYRFTTNALEQAPVGGGSGVDTPGTTTLLSRIASAITITAGKIDVADKTGFSLTAAYDAAKIASSQSSVDAVKFSTDHLSSAMEADGAVYRFTTNALENAPAGGGGGT